LIFLASATFTSVFFINFCAAVFRCGCRSLWAGADSMCNIHSAGAHHCPWCAHNPAFGYLAMTVSQGFISFWPTESAWWKRLAVALAAFPVFGGVAAVIYGTASGYW
jgi:hypothetical protein